MKNFKTNYKFLQKLLVFDWNYSHMEKVYSYLLCK